MIIYKSLLIPLGLQVCTSIYTHPESLDINILESSSTLPKRTSSTILFSTMNSIISTLLFLAATVDLTLAAPLPSLDTLSLTRRYYSACRSNYRYCGRTKPLTSGQIAAIVIVIVVCGGIGCFSSCLCRTSPKNTKDENPNAGMNVASEASPQSDATNNNQQTRVLDAEHEESLPPPAYQPSQGMTYHSPTQVPVTATADVVREERGFPISNWTLSGEWQEPTRPEPAAAVPKRIW